MPNFKYKAKKITGEEIEGTKESQDKFELSHGLKQEGYILISAESEEIARKETPLIFAFFISIIGRVSVAEKMIFSRNLAVMLAAGLPISRALPALGRQAKSKKLKKAIIELGADIQKGEPLSTAMDHYPEIFSSFFTAMVRSGEKTGRLPESLGLISQQLEKNLVLTRRIRGAMVYPSIVLSAMVGIGALMMVYVVPTLISVFSELDVELPLATRIIIFISNAIVNNSFLVILFLLFIVGAIFWAFRSKIGRRLSDFIFIRLPLISSLIKKINSSRTARTLSSLLGAGVDVVESFEVAKNIVQNHYYQEVLEKAKKEIQKGSQISKIFLSAENLYPSLVGEMIAVGEETGQLSNMLLRLADFYEEEVNEATKDLTVIIEPILMIFIGAAVGFFAISMIQPMYSMMSGI